MEAILYVQFARSSRVLVGIFLFLGITLSAVAAEYTTASEYLQVELGLTEGEDDMCSWNYADDRFLELRFEDVAANEVHVIEKLLTWYGLSAKDAHAVSRALEFLSFERVKAAAKSEPGRDRHIGTGSPLGRLQRYFSHRVQSAFDARFPDALDVLGYA